VKLLIHGIELSINLFISVHRKKTDNRNVFQYLLIIAAWFLEGQIILDRIDQKERARKHT
jgi:hypothetical protein